MSDIRFTNAAKRFGDVEVIAAPDLLALRTHFKGPGRIAPPDCPTGLGFGLGWTV